MFMRGKTTMGGKVIRFGGEIGIDPGRTLDSRSTLHLFVFRDDICRVFRTQECWFHLLDVRLAGITGCGQHGEGKVAPDRSTDGTSIGRGLGRRRRCR